eukprot:1194524-Prorocentrum_minimum.AAC.3
MLRGFSGVCRRGLERFREVLAAVVYHSVRVARRARPAARLVRAPPHPPRAQPRPPPASAARASARPPRTPCPPIGPARQPNILLNKYKCSVR